MSLVYPCISNKFLESLTKCLSMSWAICKQVVTYFLKPLSSSSSRVEKLYCPETLTVGFWALAITLTSLIFILSFIYKIQG